MDLSNILGGNDYSGADATPAIPAPNVPMAANPDPGPAPDLGSSGPSLDGGLNWTPTAPAAPAAQPDSSSISWRSVLRGALAGLAGASQPTRGRGGFAQGLGLGAGAELQQQQQDLQNQQRQQQITASVKFSDAQAANLAMETAIRDKQLHQMDTEEQDRHNSASLGIIERMNALGITPDSVIPNNAGGAEAQAFLQNKTATDGAVGPHASIVFGHQIINYDLNQLVQKPQGLAVINDVRSITDPTAPPLSQDDLNRMKPMDAKTLLNNSISFDTPHFDNLQQGMNTQLQYGNYLATLKAQPKSPANDAAITRVQKAYNLLTDEINSAASRDDKRKADAYKAETPGIVDRAKQLAQIKSDNAPDKPDKNAGNMMVATMPDGTQVAGTPADLQANGADVSKATKLPTSEAGKVVVARQMISPNGLLSNVEKDISAFKPEELTAIGARWNEFQAGTLGAGDPRYIALRTDSGLLSTALMQAHVGAKGSEFMMEHFADLANAGKMNGNTLKTAVATERRYMTEKAMLPKAPSTQSGSKSGDPFAQFGGKAH